MNKKYFLAAVGAALVLAAALVTAGSQAATTPLYTIRMEQQSNKMHFLPTAVTEFTYTTESGVILGTVKGCIVKPLLTGEPICYLTGETCKATCSTCSTCSSTCGYTCGCSCGFTCDTCIATCGTTCNPTCDAITCDSCIQTCITCSSCSLTCSTC